MQEGSLTLRSLLRFYLYTVTTVALLYLMFALQDALDLLFLHVGLTDTVTLAGLLGLIFSPPWFGNWIATLIATLIVFLIGALHWYFLRRDLLGAKDEPTSKIRAAFLAALSAALGLRALFALVLIARTANVLSRANLPIAAPLAAALAASLALGLVVVEWLTGEQFDEMGKSITLFFSLLGQWVVVIAIGWAIDQLVQSTLQSLVAPLPQCSPSLDVVTQVFTFIASLLQQCANTAPLLNAALTLILIAGAWVCYAVWSARYMNGALTNLDAVFGATVVGVVVLYGVILGLRFALDIFRGQPGAEVPRSLLSSPGVVGVASYPFVGALIAGCCLFAVYFRRERMNEHKDDGSTAQQFAEVTISFLLGAAFFTGACWLLGDALVALLSMIGLADVNVSAADWNFGVMLFIPGFVGGWVLFRRLERYGCGLYEPQVSLPGRIYVYWFRATTLFAAVISVLLFVVVIVADRLDIPVDPTNYFSPHLIAITLVTTPFVVYYFQLKKTT